MSKSTYIAAASTALVIAASMSTVALAWHPQGKITKEVQNVTQNSAYADANDASTAIAAHRGDTLRYRITIVNPADPAANNDNDLGKIKVSDTLPAGVTLTSGSKDKDFGSAVVAPQNTTGNVTKSASYDFTVTVNDDVADGTVLCNTADFTGNSAVGDAPRAGEDLACVKVSVPPTPVTPPVTTTPVTPEAPVTELPSTGPSALLTAVSGVTLSGLAYGAISFVQRRK